MQNEEIDEIDYEDMDDLPLTDHVEWNLDQTKELSKVALDPIFG